MRKTQNAWANMKWQHKESALWDLDKNRETLEKGFDELRTSFLDTF